MIDIKEYIEIKKEYRLRAEYDNGEYLYIQGKTSLNTALALFELAAARKKELGRIKFIQEHIGIKNGGKRTVWHRHDGWGRLERDLKSR